MILKLPTLRVPLSTLLPSFQFALGVFHILYLHKSLFLRIKHQLRLRLVLSSSVFPSVSGFSNHVDEHDVSLARCLCPNASFEQNRLYHPLHALCRALLLVNRVFCGEGKFNSVPFCGSQPFRKSVMPWQQCQVPLAARNSVVVIVSAQIHAQIKVPTWEQRTSLFQQPKSIPGSVPGSSLDLQGRKRTVSHGSRTHPDANVLCRQFRTCIGVFRFVRSPLCLFSGPRRYQGSVTCSSLNGCPDTRRIPSCLALEPASLPRLIEFL